MLKRLHHDKHGQHDQHGHPTNSAESSQSSTASPQLQPSQQPSLLSISRTPTSATPSFGLEQYVEVMPDENRAILTGKLYKLTSGHVQKWEQREMLLNEDRLSYSIDNKASKAWNTLELRVAESIQLLDIEEVVSLSENANINTSVHGDGPPRSKLSESRKGRLDPSVGHMGVVKKRGHFNAAYKTRFLVLSDAMLEYYEDEKAYHVQNEGRKGSMPTRNAKVTSATLSGAIKSNDGYHFTIEDTSNGKLIECACEDAKSRDIWVQKIQASYHHATIKAEKVTIEVCIKPKEGYVIGRVHCFHAANEQECLTWTKAIQEAIANARKRHLSTSMSARRRIQIKLRSIYNTNLVQFTVVAVIIANFVANIVEFELMSADPAVIKKFTDLDLAFTILFTFELIANMIAHMDMLPYPFLSDSWNIMDMIVVLVSLVSVSNIVEGGGVKAIRVMRAFRVVRVFRRLNSLRSIIKVDVLNSSLVTIFPVCNV
jgi:hypothetical protein